MKKGICFILAILLVYGVALLSEPIYAQDEITIVGEGSLFWVPDDGSIEAGWVADDFTLYFQPSGGPVTGSAYIEFDFTPNDKNKEILYYDFQFNGYFEGGDGGEINGTVSQEVRIASIEKLTLV
jgi:hypothetical protein